jgi:hypothetical protein
MRRLDLVLTPAPHPGPRPLPALNPLPGHPGVSTVLPQRPLARKLAGNAWPFRSGAWLCNACRCAAPVTQAACAAGRAAKNAPHNTTLPTPCKIPHVTIGCSVPPCAPAPKQAAASRVADSADADRVHALLLDRCAALRRRRSSSKSGEGATAGVHSQHPSAEEDWTLAAGRGSPAGGPADAGARPAAAVPGQQGAPSSTQDADPVGARSRGGSAGGVQMARVRWHGQRCCVCKRAWANGSPGAAALSKKGQLQVQFALAAAAGSGRVLRMLKFTRTCACLPVHRERCWQRRAVLRTLGAGCPTGTATA